MDLLLQTKLGAPVIRDRLVTRSRLLLRLEDGLQREGEFLRKLTLVSAPAGYGKTTLVAGWMRTVSRPFTWLSLDETDNDPLRFLAYLVAAVNKMGVGQSTNQVLRSSQPPPAEAVISILLNEITASQQMFYLVLDDYHTIHAPQIHKVVSFFLEHQPACIHLILITREDPLLPIPRLRSQGRVLEIRQEDLRFTADEENHFLCDVMNLDLSLEEMAVLEQRTEGWIAGLQLAALAMQGISSQGSTAMRDFIQEFAGSSRFVIDYLITEVFQQQPGSIQEFLLNTAILQRMTGELCDILTGQSGSQALLEHLEQSNLFIIPLDQDRVWYRYHHLFLEFLRHRLRTQFSAKLPELHLSASRWFEANGYLAEAIQHAIAAASWERAGSLIEQAKDAMLRHGEIATLLGWYRSLPEVFIHSKPDLCLGYAWPLLLSSQPDLAESLLISAEPMIAEGSTIQGDFFALQAYLARVRGDHAAVIKASEQALPLLTPTNPAARGTLAVNLGIAYWHCGRLDDTEKIMAEVQYSAAQSGNLYAVLTARFFRARVLASRGLLHQAEAQYQQLIRESGQTPITALLHYDLCILDIEWDHLEAAEQHSRLGMELSAQTANPEFLSSGHMLKALIHLARQNFPAALAEADQAYELAREYPPSVRARSEALYVRIMLAMGNIQKAVRWAEQMPPIGDVHPLYRYLDLTHPRLLIALGKKEEARELLAKGCQVARENGWGYGLVAGLSLQALVASTSDEAITLISEALHLAQPENYLGTFLDAGSGLVPLLQEAARRGYQPAYAGHLIAEINAHGGFVSIPGLPEPLSEREIEVLRLVVAGFSNREIARQLVITLGTAKTHIHNICGKLGANNRMQVAIKAKEMNLV